MSTFTILQIDDNTDIKFLSEKAFKKTGFHYMFAATVDEGLKLALSEKPDLLLVDYFMEDMTGIEMLRLIHNDSKYKEIAGVPSILLTGDTDQVMSVISKNDLNIISFLRKPFGMRELVNIVENVYWSQSWPNSQRDEIPKDNLMQGKQTRKQNDDELQHLLMLKGQFKHYADTIHLVAQEMFESKKNDVMDEDYINYFTVYNCSRHILRLLEQSSLLKTKEPVDHDQE